MTILEDTYAFLESRPTLFALIAGRAWIVMAPENETLPYLVFHRISSTEPGDLLGDSGGSSETMIRFTAWAETHAKAEAVAEAMRIECDGYGMVSGGSPYGERTCRSFRRAPGSVNDVYAHSAQTQTDQTGAYGVQCDYLVVTTRDDPAPRSE